MKKHILTLLSIIFCTAYSAAQTPSWVSKRPVSEKEYIGIGMAQTNEANYIDGPPRVELGIIVKADQQK